MIKRNKFTKKRSPKNAITSRKGQGPISFYKQINESDYYIVDNILTLTDAVSSAFDMFTSYSAVTDYTNLVILYGEFRTVSVHFRFMPYMTAPVVATDSAVGAIAVKQGKFDTAPAAISLGGVVSLPGSILINNMIPFNYSIPLSNVNSLWYSSGMTNTIVSTVPKLIFYANYGTLATTHTNSGLLHIRIGLQCRSKNE